MGMAENDRRLDEINQIGQADSASTVPINLPGDPETKKIGLKDLSMSIPTPFKYRIYRNNFVKIGEFSYVQNWRRFTMLLTGSSHYGYPATFIVEYGGFGAFYSVMLTTRTPFTDQYYGEIIIDTNNIYMKSGNYVDDFTVTVLDSSNCLFFKDYEETAEPLNQTWSSREHIYKLIP